MNRSFVFLGLVVILSLSACAHLPPMGILQQDSLSAQEHTTLADTYRAQGEKNLALQQYQAALHRDKHFIPALMALGNIAYEDKNWDLSRSYFSRVLKVSPGHPGASNNLAMVYLAEGKHLDEARQLILHALPQAGPLTPYLLDTSANLDILAGRYAEAKASLEQAQAHPPSNDAAFPEELKKSWERWADAVDAHDAAVK